MKSKDLDKAAEALDRGINQGTQTVQNAQNLNANGNLNENVLPEKPASMKAAEKAARGK